jgi:hypothetical protein
MSSRALTPVLPVWAIVMIGEQLKDATSRRLMPRPLRRGSNDNFRLSSITGLCSPRSVRRPAARE